MYVVTVPSSKIVQQRRVRSSTAAVSLPRDGFRTCSSSHCWLQQIRFLISCSSLLSLKHGMADKRGAALLLLL